MKCRSVPSDRSAPNAGRVPIFVIDYALLRPMADVFISYSRVDAGFVRKLHDALAAREREAWVDWEDIPLTAEWLDEIYTGIDGAHNFAFVITPESVNSVTCQKEIVHAVESHKRLIPILHRAIQDTAVPEAIAKLNFVFLRDSDDFETAFASLLEALDSDLDWKRAHTRLLVRAKEWERKGYSQSLLLRGDDLQDAEQWQAQGGTKEPRPTPVQSQYILASRQAETRRQRLKVGWSTTALAVTAGLAVVALLQRNTARREAAIATARQLAAQAEIARATSPEASALLSVESFHLAPVQENSAAIHKTLPLMRKALAVLRHGDAVDAVAFNPEGNVLATGSLDRTARIFSVPNGNPIIGYQQRELVASVDFSPDGHYLATGSWNGIASVMSDADPTHPVELKHNGRVNAVAFSPDGKYLATASWDKSARVFEVGTWKQLAQVAHNDIVVAVAWDPSSRYVVSAGFDHLAKVFEAVTGNLTHVLQLNGAVHAVAFSPDGRYVAAGAWDKTARIFEAFSGNAVTRLDLPNNVEAVTFSPDSRYLLTGSDDNTARVFEVLTGREIVRFEHQGAVGAVAWSPDGQYAASASVDSTAAVFDPSTGRLLAHLEHPATEGGLSTVAFSRDSRYIATGGFDATARISRVINPLGSPVRLEHQGKILTVALSPHGEYLATGTWNNAVLISDVTSGKTVAQMAFKGAIYAIGFSRDGRYVAAAEDSIPSVVQVAEVQGGRLVMQLKGPSTARALTFSPDGRSLATVGGADTLEIIPFPTGKSVVKLCHEKRANTLDEILGTAFSPDGRYVATSRTDGLLRVFETSTGRLVTTLRQQGAAMSLAFSPDARYLLARMSDNSARIIEAKKGRIAWQYAGGVLAVAYSPDGRYIAAGTEDSAVHVFAALNGSPVARIEMVGPVRAVEFSRDGNSVISAASENKGSEDVTMVVRRDAWNQSDLATQVCSVLNRNFSGAEWKQYFPGQPYRRTCPNLP